MIDRRSISFACKTAVPTIAIALAISGAQWVTPSLARAQAESEDSLAPKKAYWQDRYRALRREAARLRRVIEVETELYADANRRNYRRGPVRHEHRLKATEAEAELAQVEEELDGIWDEARRSGALPGWLYEVEDEPIDVPATPAPPDPDATEAAAGDRAGRNPLYLEDGDDGPSGEAGSRLREGKAPQN